MKVCSTKIEVQDLSNLLQQYKVQPTSTLDFIYTLTLPYKRNLITLSKEQLSTEYILIGQCFNKFILIKVYGVLIAIDQHALHERIRLDKLGNNSDESKSIACRGAIKFNEKLTCERMKYLIDLIKKVRNPFICAHGRPCVVLLK